MKEAMPGEDHRVRMGFLAILMGAGVQVAELFEGKTGVEFG